MSNTSSRFASLVAIHSVMLAFAAGCTANVDPPDPSSDTKSGGAGGEKTGAASSASTEAASGKAACDQTIDWANHRTGVCDSCKRANCAPQIRALTDVASSCESQYTAALACNTCGCVENAITNRDLCKNPWDAYITCIASSCESPCR